eukprot:855767-Prorocentrum_minimum.AAC.13
MSCIRTPQFYLAGGGGSRALKQGDSSPERLKAIVLICKGRHVCGVRCLLDAADGILCKISDCSGRGVDVRLQDGEPRHSDAVLLWGAELPRLHRSRANASISLARPCCVGSHGNRDTNCRNILRDYTLNLSRESSRCEMTGN